MDKKPCVYIFDLDGTLNDNDGRYYHHGELTDFDNIKGYVWEIYQRLWRSKGRNTDLIILTGRSDEFKTQTENWLAENGLKYDKLILKPRYSPQKGVDFKVGILESLKQRYQIAGVFDDRIEHVDKWRAMGLPCFCVADNHYTIPKTRFGRFISKFIY